MKMTPEDRHLVLKRIVNILLTMLALDLTAIVVCLLLDERDAAIDEALGAIGMVLLAVLLANREHEAWKWVMNLKAIRVQARTVDEINRAREPYGLGTKK